jgi:hypothetical protein
MATMGVVVEIHERRRTGPPVGAFHIVAAPGADAGSGEA